MNMTVTITNSKESLKLNQKIESIMIGDSISLDCMYIYEIIIFLVWDKTEFDKIVSDKEESHQTLPTTTSSSSHSDRIPSTTPVSPSISYPRRRENSQGKPNQSWPNSTASVSSQNSESSRNGSTGGLSLRNTFKLTESQSSHSPIQADNKPAPNTSGKLQITNFNTSFNSHNGKLVTNPQNTQKSSLYEKLELEGVIFKTPRSKEIKKEIEPCEYIKRKQIVEDFINVFI